MLQFYQIDLAPADIRHLARQGSKDLGTVCLGASAILVSRTVPSFVCSECTDFDIGMLISSGSFFVAGMVLRFMAQDDDNSGNS